MHPLLGKVLDALGVHFASYFLLRFQNRFSMDFLSILDGFWEDFGRPKSSKKRYLGCFRGYDVRDFNFGRIWLDF